MPKSDSTWLSYCYILFAVVVAVVFSFAFKTFGDQMGWAETVEYFKHYSNAGSLVLGVGIAFWFSNNPGRREYHISVINEVRKVRWPTAEATRQMTVIVAIVVAIFAVILFCFDTVWLTLLKLIA